MFTKNQTNPYFQAVRVGAETRRQGARRKVIQYIPTKPDSIPEQLSQVEDVIVKKPDAIVFIPVDYKALVPAVEKINAAGIPVTNITDRIAGGKLVAYVGADDYSIGLATGARPAQGDRRQGQRGHPRGRQGLAHQHRPRARLQRRAEGDPERQAARLAARQLSAAATRCR